KPYNAVAIRAPRENSMQPEFPVQRPELRRLDQLAVCDTNGMQRTLELLPPESQEAMQLGKFGEEIVVLPDVGLQQPAMIRTAIHNMRGRQAKTTDLLTEIL